MDTEFALAESEPDFKSIVEGIADVIWTAEVDGALHYLSPQFKTMFGLEPEDWIGRSPYELVHPDDLKIVEEATERQTGDQPRISFECRHLCQKGYIWVSIIAVQVFDEEGNLVRRQGTIRDISDRKRLEKEQARLVQILQSTSDFVGICQPEVGILWQNNPFRELRSDLDIAGQDVSISELYPDWAYEIVKNEGLPTAIEDGIWSGETALLDQLGNEIPTSQVVIAHKSEEGKVEYFSTILRDISKIKATELELRNAQAELLATTKNVPGVIYRTLFHPDGSHSFAYVSPSFRTIFGLEPDAPLKDAGEFWTRIHPDDLEEIRRKTKRSAETGEPYHATYRLRHDEKGMRWFGSWALPSRLENGDIAFDGILIDVHDRKVTELAQSDAQAQYRRMTDNVPAVLFRAVIHADGSHEMTFVNDSVREVLGLDPEVLLGDTNEVWKRIHPDDIEEIERQMRHSMETLEPKHSSYRLVLEEKGTRWIESWALPTRLDNGDTVFDGIMIDITDRKAEELALKETQTKILSTTENIPGVIFRWVQHPDGSRDLAYVSPNVRQVYGLDPQEQMADENETRKRIPPEDLEEIDCRMNHCAVTLEPFHVVHQYVLDERDRRWIESWALPSRQENGDVFFDGIAIDVTRLKAEEIEQGKAQAELVATTENVPGVIFRGVVRVDGSQQTTYISPSARELLGIEPDALLANANELWKRIHPDDLESVERSMHESIESLEPFRSIHRMVVEGRGTRWIESLSLPTKLDNGDTVFNGIATDITDRKAEELKQNEAQSQLRDMTENVPGVISRVVLHPDGSHELSYVSSRVHELYGLDPQALMADMNEVWNRIHPDDVETVRRAMNRSAETLEPYQAAYRLVLEDRGTRWVHAWSLPSKMDNGDIVFDGIMIDVTDLGRLDSLQREINFRQIFDNAPDAVFLIGTVGEDKGQIVAANRSAERMHGYDGGELIGKPIEELDTPEFAQKAPERLKRLAQGEMLTFEVEHFHKNGSVFPVEVTASRILVDDRPYVLAFDRDLTERKKAEQERIELQNQLLKTQKLAAELDLTKTQTQLQKMTENIPGLVYQFVLHTDGSPSLTYISSKCREFFGVDPEEILNDIKVFWELLEPEDSEQALERVAHSAETLEPYILDYRVSLPGQGIRWYNDTAQPQRLPNGDVVWDGVALDVTDRREVELANEALAKADETKDLFLANMSHELRTPLSAILGMTEGLKLGLFGDTSHKQLESLRVVEESGLHLLDLINEILDMAKIETGTTSLRLSNVKVAELCDSCLDLVAPQAARKAIKLSFIKSTYNLPLLIADETRLRQILINLLGNALKFTPEGGTVSLEVERLSNQATSSSDETLRFVVADNGIGIECKHIDTLFQPFVQVDNSFSRNFPGSGLGLSLVKQFVELHSGTISVESEPGKGSQFIVELPYLKQGADADQKAGEEANTTPPRNNANATGHEETGSDVLPLILLAEDNDHVAMAIAPFLEASDFRVVRAVNGAVAVELASEHKPDLILMDIQMPVMDGLEAIRQIRSSVELQDTPIIALSGFAMPEDSDRCLEVGANTFLSKPCKMPVMISKIRQLISSRTAN